MDYRYGQFDGSLFPTPDSLFPTPKVVDFIMQYGQQGLDALNHIDGREGQELIQQLIDAGLLEREEGNGALRLTPRLLRGIQHKALLDIFEGLKKGAREGHQTAVPGRGEERGDGGKPYEFGDPISELDLGATMRNAFYRLRQGGARPGLPIRLAPEDLELHLSEGRTDAALCILLDMSGSMMRWGRFYHAKRVALGLAALMRRKFPLDSLDVVGFYSTACVIPEMQLPLVMPKPISVREYQVRVRVPLDQALAQPQRVPQHFTNLQLGLRMARSMLSRRGATNKQIFIITDGQPTAHVEPNPAGAGEMLCLLYPPNERTSTATLHEALRCQQSGIRIATFALIEDYWGMDWVDFVTRMTRLTRGMAYYCSSDDLSSTVIESYLSGKKRKSFIS